MGSYYRRNSRRVGLMVGAFMFVSLTSAANYPEGTNVLTTEAWERMVLTIGLGATLALIFAAITTWMIRHAVVSAEARENRIMDELSQQRAEFVAEIKEQRNTFADAIGKVGHLGTCPLRAQGTKDIFDKELHRGEKSHED